MTSRRTLLKALPAAAIAAAFSKHAFAATGPQDIPAGTVANWTVGVNTSTNLRPIPDSMFGFNMPWLSFQNGFTYTDTATGKQRVYQDVIDMLSHFPGANYRYPGGTPSNNFNWNQAWGASRATQSCPGVGNGQALFGIHELIDFVIQVGGKLIYTLNLPGYGSTPDTVQNRVDDIALQVQAMYDYMDSLGHGDLIDYWELGNELEYTYSQSFWTAQNYAAYAGPIFQKIKQIRPTAKVYVQAITDGGNSGITWRGTWDADVKNLLKTNYGVTPDGVAIHAYYDRAPSSSNWTGLSIPAVNNVLAKSVNAWNPAGSTDPIIPFAVSEHGLQGYGASSDVPYWPLSSAGMGAIATADFLLDLINNNLYPEKNIFRSATYHALEKGGPWELIHFGANNTFVPSATYVALLCLRQGMRSQMIKATGWASGYDQVGTWGTPVTSGYWYLPGVTGGGYPYKYRLIGTQKDDLTQGTILGVNRMDQPAYLSVAGFIPTSSAKTITVHVVSGLDQYRDNPAASPAVAISTLGPYDSTQQRLGGPLIFNIPAYSVFYIDYV
ncbi:hypothetical protein [Amantichitinum ursilacus]|uniref:Intracellular exo-alpha-(1->5)-L-arabinofuranosidase n=1 Tax=Amantichitinum ursilacus TaxID=857265 RepID=A0A0N0XN54_9NEIS|nr:hypothetical protein [Amantichitinum ursilacus]KPC55373.1 Intracellular exo-alpha-(1->5)-L-arabinofuranosidase [Amantichitinum ursilacus]